MKKNYPDSFITLEKAKKPDSQMTLLSRFPGTMTKVLSLFFLLFFATLTSNASDQHVIVGWNYGNGKVMYCGMGYMMSPTGGYWGDFFQHNAQKTLFVNMVKMNSYVTNPVVGIFYSPGSSGYPNSIPADTLIAILGRSGITGVKVTSDMIDTQAEINNYNVLILGGSGQWGGELGAGYLTVQSVVKSFVQNNHGGVIFTGWSVYTLLGIGASDYNDMIPVELSPDYGYQDTYTLLKHLPEDPLFNGVGTIASTGYCEFPQGNIKAGAIAYGGLAPYVPYVLPTVTTAAITTFNANTATMGGNVTAEGTAPVTSRGVVYSSTDNTPELGESGVLADANGSGPGIFSESVGGLAAGTTYYVRAYATSTAGTSYGGTVNFITQAAPVAPIITHFSPVTGTIGTTVTIYGSGFSTTPANNTVWFGAVKATVSASTVDAITITVPAGAGSVVPVYVQVNGLTAYSETSSTPVFNFTNSPVIAPYYNINNTQMAGGPSKIAIGDLNNDGLADLATSNRFGNSVGILLGTGSGNFTAASFITVGNAPIGIAVGDLNGDGKNDIVTANMESYNVSVLLGNGAGGFASPVYYSLNNGPYSVNIADFNGDGLADLVTTSFHSSRISILLGTGGGNFAAATYPDGFVNGSQSIAIGDYNGDGKADLATANSQSNTTSIFLGIGNGTFSTPTDFPTGGNWNRSIESADFNNDGNADLAVSNTFTDNVSILIGNGAGSFSAPSTFAVGDTPYYMNTGDFNGDGNIDIAAANYASNSISLLLGDGLGSFAAATNINLLSPHHLAAGDFNNDGKADIATCNYDYNSVNVLLWHLPCTNPSNGGVVATDQIICYGNIPVSLSSEELPVGHTGTLEYKWQFSTTSASAGFNDIELSNSATWSPDALTTTTWFRRMARVECITNEWASAAVSNTVTITVLPEFTAGAIETTGETICFNSDPVEIPNATAASGGDGTISYQWQSSTVSELTGFADISGADEASYNPPSGLTESTWYRRMAKDATCNITFNTSAGVWKVTVNPEFTAGAIETTGETICFNSDPGEIPNATAASGGDETISYQWQSSTVSELTGFNNISGANDVTYNPPSGLTESTWYRRTAKDGSCSSSPAKQPLKLNSQIHSPLVYNKNELQTIPQNSFSIANGKAGGASPNQNRSVALRYDDGVNFDGLGLIAGGTFLASAYWPAATMGLYTGMKLSQVEIYIRDVPSSCVIKIYGQGTANTPGNLLHEQVVTVAPTSWNLISLTNEVEITGEDMWIGYEVTHDAGLFPAGIDDGPAVAGFGDILKIEEEWYTLSGIGWDNNWNIAATLIDGGEYTISAGVWKVNVLEDFTPGAIETTGENICYNGDPAQIGSATPASGGDQVISYQWQSSTTGESTDFSDIIGADEASYNPPSGITETTWFLRMAKDGTCQTSFTASAGLWKVTVEPSPVAGTLTKTPNVMNVCENDLVSAILTAGNGGNGIDELEFRTNDGSWSAWAAYVSGTDISTADLSGVEIRTRRTASTCSSSAYTTVSWSVEATPIAGLLTKTPDVMNVCENDIVSAILTSGNGGNGIDELEFRTNNGTWSAWAAYTSGANISTADLSGVEIRTRRTASYCESTAYVSVSWSVEATPIAGSLAKTPNVMNVCENDLVSAILTAGNGGNGIDELEFRTNNGTWSAWAAYVSGTDISTADLSGVEIRTRRMASTCSSSAYTTVSWSVEATPIAGLLTKTPDVMNVCENDIISAILTSGNGGNGIDELEFRTNTGTWSAWAAYTSGSNISTADLSGVEIRTRRTASTCSSSAYTNVSWSVEATPIAGLLTKTPDVMNVCENDLVSAILTSGNGGNGIDELEFRTNDGTWSAWTAYVSGTNISTADLSGVEIRTRRAASTCLSSAYTTVSWSVEATPIAGSLAKTPNVMNVCENDLVSAILTSGNGGNGIDELEFRTYNGTWSAWVAYTSGSNISTADLSGIEIRTRRMATYCESTAYVSVGWSVEASPIAGSLAKTPNVMNVCENDLVSAILTSGNGGNGIDELEFRTNDGTWSAWAAYVSGTDISTADLSGVEIRTRRTASTCSSSAYTTVTWTVEATPIAGMLVKTPDVDDVCIGELISATLIAGTGGNGTDFLEYRTHDGSAWTDWSAYISGTSINTTPFTSVEIRTWRTATYCDNSDFNVVSWDVNPLTVGGVVEGPEGVCYGTNSTILTATGYTGSIVMWQTSTNYWATITNIQHTEPTLLVEDLTVTTQFRTVVQSGSCSQLYSIAAEIGVDPIPAPFIAGAEAICDLNEIYEYATEPDMVNYQWSVSSGQIISGQGSNLITVQWSGSGDQSITVEYQTVFGCTMPEPFSITVEILTPETPVITIGGFTLTSSATEGNQWYMNGIIIEGATSQTYEVTENGDYTCVVTLNDCSSDVSNTISVLNVGTNPSLSLSMDVYPVPNKGQFTVKLLSPGSSNYTLTIYNALGSVVYSRESIAVHSGFSQMIDLTNSPTGIYTVVMQNENNRFIRKIVITK